MGSKTKTKTSQEKGKKGIFGMGPGQSQAMAGNTGLAGATEAQALQIQKGLQNLGQPSSFQAIGQNIGEVGSKYRRPADIESYADKMQKLNQALDAGAKFFTGPDGIERVNLANTGIKDEQGRTVLSMMSPELTATAPTMGQLGGDIARAFTGYNSLQYTDPKSNVPEMVRTQGLADVLARAAIPGSLALSLVQDLYGKGKNFLFPQEEDDESSAADATGGASVMGLGDIRTAQNLANTRSSDLVALLRGDTSVDPNVQVGSFEPDTPFISVRNPNTGETEFMMDPDPGLARAVLGDETIQDLIRLNQYPSRTLQEEPTMNFPMAEGRTDLSPAEKARQDLEAAGYSDDQINAIIDKTFFAGGGLIPPNKGPMSEGVASLFETK
jgi:hypothetical protein